MVENENFWTGPGGLRQVGVMPNAELAAELGIGPDSDSWLVSVETMANEGGPRPEFADRLVPVYVAEPDSTMTGAALINAERHRQVEVKGFRPDHDTEHDKGELATAASLYIRAALVCETKSVGERSVRRILERQGKNPDKDEDFQQMVENPARHFFGWDKAPSDWPWEKSWWKPSADPIRNLVKAGALIAAEIDRLRHG
jgi:hypothetical protein